SRDRGRDAHVTSIDASGAAGVPFRPRFASISGDHGPKAALQPAAKVSESEGVTCGNDMSRPKRILLAFPLLLSVTLAVTPSAKLKWRMLLLTLKLGGRLPSVSWTEVLRRVGPSSIVGSQISSLDPSVGKLLADLTRPKPCEV